MSPWCGYRLPENVDLILLKNPISADQRHGFNGRLRNQQAIERVPVAQGQSVQILYVIQRDGQQGDIIFREIGFDNSGGDRLEMQLAQLLLDLHLPGRNQAEEKLIGPLLVA